MTANGSLSSVQHLLCDMDGVLFRGADPLPGAAEFIAWLRESGVRFQLITNNSTATPATNVAMLGRLGIRVNEGEILTSSIATALYLKESGARGQAVYVIGEEGLITALESAGMHLTEVPEEAAWVVAGLDREVTYARLRDASFAIEHGARFVATNADGSLPVEWGKIPGAGALQAAITTTTGKEPKVIGKPEPLMLTLGMERIHGSAASTAMLGDRLDTDIEAAHRCGIPSILVLTGISSEHDAQASSHRPTFVYDDLPHLMRDWSRARLGT